MKAVVKAKAEPGLWLEEVRPAASAGFVANSTGQLLACRSVPGQFDAIEEAKR